MTNEELIVGLGEERMYDDAYVEDPTPIKSYLSEEGERYLTGADEPTCWL